MIKVAYSASDTKHPMKAIRTFFKDVAIETADRYKLPLIIDTDEGVKRDKYCHLGVHQVTGRDFGDSRYSYGMIRECGR